MLIHKLNSTARLTYSRTPHFKLIFSNITITLLIFLSAGGAAAQSKKERIELLSSQKDSLIQVLEHERLNHNTEKEELLDSLKDINSTVIILNRNIDSLIQNQADLDIKFDSLESIITLQVKKIQSFNDQFTDFIFKGISLKNLLGKAITITEFQQILNNCSLPKVESSETDSEIGSIYYFYDEGLKIELSRDNQVTGISLYAPGNEEFKTFQGELGYGLNWQMTKSMVDSKIGPLALQGFIDGVYYLNGIYITYNGSIEKNEILSITLYSNTHPLFQHSPFSEGNSFVLLPSEKYLDFTFEIVAKDLQLTHKNNVVLDTSFFDLEWKNRVLIESNKHSIWENFTNKSLKGNERYFIGINDEPYGYRTLILLEANGSVRRIAENEYLNVTSAYWYNNDILIFEDCLEGWCNIAIYNSFTNSISILRLPEKFDSDNVDCYSPYLYSVIPITENEAAFIIYFQTNPYEYDGGDCLQKKIPSPIIYQVKF